MDTEGFASLLARVADGWNTGAPAEAADCFTVDAVYLEPPNAQHYVGREELSAFFHGEAAEPRAMSMTWHHVAYDPDGSVGFGEYTFSIANGFAAHGVAVVSVRGGQIATWREYQYPSAQPFRDFAGDSLGPPPHS
jgi:uncharacterized protein (TIGR02246 family)